VCREVVLQQRTPRVGGYNMSSSLTSLRLYRILLRQIRTLPANQILLQPPLNPDEHYGRAEYFPKSRAFHLTRNDIYRLLYCWNNHPDTDDEKKNCNNPWWEWYSNWVVTNSKDTNDVTDDDHTDDYHRKDEIRGWTNRDTLYQAIRYAFEYGKQHVQDMEKSKIVQYQNFAIHAIRSLEQVRQLHELSSISLQDGLCVVATSRYEK
jgi:hypothetical protein